MRAADPFPPSRSLRNEIEVQCMVGRFRLGRIGGSFWTSRSHGARYWSGQNLGGEVTVRIPASAGAFRIFAVLTDVDEAVVAHPAHISAARRLAHPEQDLGDGQSGLDWLGIHERILPNRCNPRQSSESCN